MSTVSPTSTNAAVESVLSAKQSSAPPRLAHSVAAKTLDAQRSAGDASIALIESAEGRGALLDTAG